MPISYDQIMSQEDMQRMVDGGAVCGKCGAGLSVAWGGAQGYKGYILRCTRDITHDTMNSHDLKREEKINQIRRARGMDSNSLMIMDEQTMLNRVSMAKFPQDLTVPEKKLLANVAITYGFDPLMGEVSIYQGKPFVSIDGRYRKSQETGQLDGVETRPATKQEREDWQIAEGDYFFRAEVYVKGASHSFVGWGKVRAAETKPGSNRQGDSTSTYKPTQSNPQRMAEKRAEAQALRKAFHIPLPSIEDIGGEDDEPVVTVTDITEKPKAIKAPAKTAEPAAVESGEVLHPDEVKAQPDEQTAAVAEEPPFDEGATKEPLINRDWMAEQLKTFKTRGITSWSNTAVVTKLNNLTGKPAKNVMEAVNNLTLEQAQVFIKEVNEAISMSAGA